MQKVKVSSTINNEIVKEVGKIGNMTLYRSSTSHEGEYIRELDDSSDNEITLYLVDRDNNVIGSISVGAICYQNSGHPDIVRILG